jgi:hypothetical protein
MLDESQIFTTLLEIQGKISFFLQIQIINKCYAILKIIPTKKEEKDLQALECILKVYCLLFRE